MEIGAIRGLLLAVMLLAASCRAATEQPHPPTLSECESAIAAIGGFLAARMTDSRTGAIFVNAADDRPSVAGEARNHDALSEAVGQMMELALLRNDRGLFGRQFALAREKFQAAPGGFLAWKIALDPLRRASTSATLDDWRVAWACREAARRWDWPEADKFGMELAAAVARGTEEHGIPPPAFNLGDSSAGRGAVLLCYLHLPAMKAFSADIPGLDGIYAASLRVLRGIPSAPGMLPAKWDPEREKYSRGVSDEVLALITLLHMQATEPDAPRLREAVEVRRRHFRKHGTLPQAFDCTTGDALGERAGAAVYALWARLLLARGLREEAGAAVRMMLAFQNAPGRDFAGAIGGYPVFSFDQIEALLALESYRAALASP